MRNTPIIESGAIGAAFGLALEGFTTKGLRPACVEVCPTGSRMFGDLKHPVEGDPIQVFIEKNKVQVLKPHLGTEPRLLYAGRDKEFR